MSFLAIISCFIEILPRLERFRKNKTKTKPLHMVKNLPKRALLLSRVMQAESKFHKLLIIPLLAYIIVLDVKEYGNFHVPLCTKYKGTWKGLCTIVHKASKGRCKSLCTFMHNTFKGRLKFPSTSMHKRCKGTWKFQCTFMHKICNGRRKYPCTFMHKRRNGRWKFPSTSYTKDVH